MSPRHCIQVAVDAPLPGPFDYLPPPGPTLPAPGTRVWVPFGRSRRLGIVLGSREPADPPERVLKSIEACLDSEPLWDTGDLALLRWAADYYHHPLGEVLVGLLPQGLRLGQSAGPRAEPGWRLTPAGRALAPAQPARAPRQQALLALLRSRGEGLERAALTAALGDCGPLLRRLLERGWVERCPLPEADRPAAGLLQPGPPLNPDQQQATAAVVTALGSFRAFLLDGITGSGKTEVYLNLIQAVLAQGGQVLALVPEIGLTPQLQRRLARRIGAPVALLHSARPAAERTRDWYLARDGAAGVVLGTRSAVFTPMPRLALILVDEEHDLSFKQQDGFRYHARDLAVRRAQQRGCPVLLGSATPSLESLRNAEAGRYQWLRLRERAGGAQLPRLDLIDLRSVRLRGGMAPALIQLLRDTLAAGQQALLFLNRRGYAPLLTCHDCGWVAGCPRCDARLTLHQESPLLWCHHCGWQHRLLEACPRDRKSTRLNSSHNPASRMPSSA
jgi:primosomal protein N' (replication factor Y)